MNKSEDAVDIFTLRLMFKRQFRINLLPLKRGKEMAEKAGGREIIIMIATKGTVAFKALT